MPGWGNGRGTDKPVHLQTAICWAPSRMAAEAEALHQWAPVSLGGEVSWDLRRPADFDRASATMRVEDWRRAC